MATAATYILSKTTPAEAGPLINLSVVEMIKDGNRVNVAAVKLNKLRIKMLNTKCPILRAKYEDEYKKLKEYKKKVEVQQEIE